MAKTVLLVHGRHYKPPEDVLRANWIEAIRHGLERDRPEALSALDEARLEMVYYGDVSNAFLSKVGGIEPYNEARDIEDRRQCLDELKTRKRSHFSETTYRRLPGANRWKEGLADVFAGPLALLGLSDRAVHFVAPDMGKYWDEATDFGSRVRAPMVRPMIEAFERNDDVCVISHSLGSLIAYDTFWKFSHMSEYNGSISPDLNFAGKLVDLWVTIGSPLADETVKDRVKGAGNRDIRRYPTNVNRWVNLAAEDDYISHDQGVANDYTNMVTAHRSGSNGRLRTRKTKIKDIRCYNLAVRGYAWDDPASNPHHGAGYLLVPEMSKLLASWLLS